MGLGRGLHLDTCTTSRTRDAGPRTHASSRSFYRRLIPGSDSAFKRAFAALQPGVTVVVPGPLGHYLLGASPAALVAGGIGITPLKGMAEYAADCKLPIPVRLVYSNRTVTEIVCREELEALERRNPNFQPLYTLTRPGSDSWKGRTGRIGGQVGSDLLAEAPKALTALSTTVRRLRLRGGVLPQSGEFRGRESRHPLRSLPRVLDSPAGHDECQRRRAELRALWLGFHRPLASVLPYHGAGYLDRAADLPTIMVPLTRLEPTMGLRG